MCLFASSPLIYPHELSTFSVERSGSSFPAFLPQMKYIDLSTFQFISRFSYIFLATFSGGQICCLFVDHPLPFSNLSRLKDLLDPKMKLPPGASREAIFCVPRSFDPTHEGHLGLYTIFHLQTTLPRRLAGSFLRFIPPLPAIVVHMKESRLLCIRYHPL